MTSNMDSFDDILQLRDIRSDEKVVGKNIALQLEVYHQQLSTIARFAPLYDSKTGVKANGFRTFVKIAATVLKILTKLFQEPNHDVKWTQDIRYWMRCLDRMITINTLLLELHEIASNQPQTCEDPLQSLSLFPPKPDPRSAEQIEKLSLRIAAMDFAPFYGRGRGFHIGDPDIRRFTGAIMFGLAMAADLFRESSFTQKAQRVIGTGFGLKYLTDPDFLAERIGEAAKELPVEFVQGFYGMSEGELLGRPLRRTMGNIVTNHVVEIPPEPLKTFRANGVDGYFEAQIPTCHGGPGNVMARLLSPFRTVDMIGECQRCKFSSCFCQLQPASDGIFFHMHGGGFISQTSKSHQTYLRQWARHLNVPILSIDYSLAPQAPYPRAIEECFFAYNWMLQNLASLGTNGKFILVGGDSAGGNFAMGLTYLCIKEGIRAPDNLVLMYPSLLCEMYPSPSRLVCLFDPLVMFPFLLRCLNSYADQDYKSNRTFVQELEGCKAYDDPLLSPLIIPDQILAKFPPVNLITTDIDPCLDEVIALSNRLVKVGNLVSLEVIQGLPHGFLSLNAVSTMAQEAVENIGKKLMQLFHQSHTRTA